MNADVTVTYAAETASERVREEGKARRQGVAAIGDRVARATGAGVVVENTGGDVMVATVDRNDGAVIALTAEGASMFGSRRAWEDGSDPLAVRDGGPEEVVATAIEWLTGSR
ncbi:hypothetical protein [Isoptericola sediminis]|uniref:Uncharacterized protein n=1 Tax=Isoptericola sediminis TaxID=2733572 RepID=A0A849K6J0_9MICO|nr:hypothetical protein [Isoptericola sediminis]NNU26787.1 hypothetical protein [Isoptericola sediminis]